MFQQIKLGGCHFYLIRKNKALVIRFRMIFKFFAMKILVSKKALQEISDLI